MPLLCCCSLPSTVTINACFNLEEISYFPTASVPPNNCRQCSALFYGGGGRAGMEMALGEFPLEELLSLWSVTRMANNL